MAAEKPTIVVTGFGPFRSYGVNPSWEAVSLLEMDNVNLIKKQIPVEYEFVDVDIPQLWRAHNPLLVVHCGVSRYAKCLVLEKKAFGSDYNQLDVNGRLPKCAIDKSGTSCSCIDTQLNIDRICEKVNGCCAKGQIKMKAEPSTDAGRYLCEYIYYRSLKENSAKTMFVHVPELGTPHTAKDIAEALKCTINVVLDEISTQEHS